ncbi:PDZ and LIM domain protein 2-like [Leptonychotes weddellii]|uniref:PDZ and LIM domain protein 2-like n=1 Tax=Leptonychotes weddellii TaxID=9713 RepID=A0A7F8RG68_LEPWE|nr:PDZ and LIM domain protein 2-like [Leptonychotes weddellii]
MPCPAADGARAVVLEYLVLTALLEESVLPSDSGPHGTKSKRDVDWWKKILPWCLSVPQASLPRASDSAVLVLPPSPGRRSSSPRLSVDSEGGSRLLEEDSEVYKMLQENREARVAPRQSSSFRLLQEALEAEERGGTPAFLPSQLSPQSALPTSRAPATPPKLHT